VQFLRSLPAASPAVAARPGQEHCEFTTSGMRVAAANPSYAQRVANELRYELNSTGRERENVERELRRVEELQKDRPRWMRLHGFSDLADELRRLERDQQTPEYWMRVRGWPPDQASRARSEMDRERRDLDRRLAAADGAMRAQRDGSGASATCRTASTTRLVAPTTW
jgi:hypothetical protein